MSTSAPRAGIVNCAAYSAEGVRRDIRVDEISDVLDVDDGSFVWVGLYEPGAPVLDQLQEEFGLHDLAIEDAENAHQRPKLEVYGDSMFIAVHTAQLVEGRIRFGETHVFVGPRYVVTVRHGASSSYAPARARLERERELLMHGPGAALYAVLDLIVDNYAPIIDEFNRMLGELENNIFAAEFSRDMVHQLYTLKRELTRLRMSVAPMQEILGHLSRARSSLFGEEIQLYLRDVLDHSVRIDASTEMLREMLTTAVSVNLSLVTVQQGEVVKRFGAWAGLLAVPTLIASWYGMNFAHMPELAGRRGYLVLIGVVGALCAILYWKFKKARWL